MPLIGTLKDLSLFNLIQLQCNERQRVRVSLTHGQQAGTLICADGELICASAGHLTGEDAVHELLKWENAEFRVDCHPAPVDRNIGVPWTALLLDGVRKVDEARAKHDDRLEASLRSMQGTHGLRAAVMVGSDGQLRAAATETAPAAEAALVTFLAGRMEAVGTSLNGGPFREVLFSGPSEAVWLARQNDAYLTCWLEGRASLTPLKALLPLLLLAEQVEGTQRVAGGSSLSH
jgi:predicted regulator of Ras-like GTPase activity (Roadblock/LC7/MglB family)